MIPPVIAATWARACGVTRSRAHALAERGRRLTGTTAQVLAERAGAVEVTVGLGLAGHGIAQQFSVAWAEIVIGAVLFGMAIWPRR